MVAKYFTTEDTESTEKNIKITNVRHTMLANIQEKHESLIKKPEDLLQQLGSLPVRCYPSGPVRINGLLLKSLNI
jgi:predicted transcriptional regulator